MIWRLQMESNGKCYVWLLLEKVCQFCLYCQCIIVFIQECDRFEVLEPKGWNHCSHCTLIHFSPLSTVSVSSACDISILHALDLIESFNLL